MSFSQWAKKWSPDSRFENTGNFLQPEMKGPCHVSVRPELFLGTKNNSSKMDITSNEKIIEDESDVLKWNEMEQLNGQVVFINPEWDEIEEEKAGIPSFLNSITPHVNCDKLVSAQVTEFVITDSESVSSVTVSLDEFGEESEEIVAVVSDSEVEVTQAEVLSNMNDSTENLNLKKSLESPLMEEAKNWKNSRDSKSQEKSDLTLDQSNKERVIDLESYKKQCRESVDSSKLMKASCYVMQNGKITKPFYIVKNPILKEGTIYKNINKFEEEMRKKNANNEEKKDLVALEKGAIKKKEGPRELQLGKLGRNQEFIRIIEHPAKAKKIIMNKVSDSKNIQGAICKRRTAECGGNLTRNSSSDSTRNSCEGEDLMWLLDFKLDNLFNESSLPAFSQLDDSLEQYTEFPGKFVDVDGSVCNFSESDADDKVRVEIGCQTETTTTRLNKGQINKLGTGKQQPKIDAKTESILPNRTFSDLKCSENRKPPFTYTELIECALQEKGPLTVSEIYNWISETFPYYKSWDDRWKNSVRHNLSINPYFRKGTKARQGSGHLWTVNKSEDNSKINSWKRQRFHEFEEFSKRLRYTADAEKQEETNENTSSHRMIDETALATASIEDKENRRLHRDVLMAACIDNNFVSTTHVSLEQSAEEILSGVKKNVEVQYLEPVKSPCENDFLNPISKEILMGECGLLNQIELNLTAETGEHLSVVDGMTDSEHIFGIPDELNFHYDISSHAPQLLPLAK